MFKPVSNPAANGNTVRLELSGSLWQRLNNVAVACGGDLEDICIQALEYAAKEYDGPAATTPEPYEPPKPHVNAHRTQPPGETPTNLSDSALKQYEGLSPEGAAQQREARKNARSHIPETPAQPLGENDGD